MNIQKYTSVVFQKVGNVHFKNIAKDNQITEVVNKR